MCGIAGFAWARAERAHLIGMAGRLNHRGPDDSGVWLDAETGVGLAHARLSVLDLTAAGHQPMASPLGRFVFVFNGEIYNHLQLREELRRAGVRHEYRGHADTETLLVGFEQWGIAETIGRAVGMFAFAVWDRERSQLTLGRDRAGEKPLYFGWMGESLLFGSELKALRSHPSFKATVNRQALVGFLRGGYVAGPESIYTGVRRLPPGSLLTLRAGERTVEPVRYWDARKWFERGIESPFRGTPSEAVDELERLVSGAVRGQLLSDVPLGAFLSGGIDSSTIVALMQAQSSQPVRTFTIGFHEARFNEADHARAVAAHLGTAHTELYVTPTEAQKIIPRLPEIYCEPFADPSQIPTCLVSALARRSVTVALSGDAGDELFGGYSRYELGDRMWSKLRLVPRPIRTAVRRVIGAISPSGWNGLVGPVRRLMGRGFAHVNVGDKLTKASELLTVGEGMDVYRRLVSQWADPAAVVLGGDDPRIPLLDAHQRSRSGSLVQQMMALDFISYLPEDILVKVDRAAMSESLETRVPLLDHRVVEFAWSLPKGHLFADGKGKWPLRQLLRRHVPPALTDRPKMGFGVPIDEWLRGPLREWAEGLLGEARLRRDGYFEPEIIRTRLGEHLSGSRNWQYPLWNVLMFQAWLDHAA